MMQRKFDLDSDQKIEFSLNDPRVVQYRDRTEFPVSARIG